MEFTAYPSRKTAIDEHGFSWLARKRVRDYCQQRVRRTLDLEATGETFCGFRTHGRSRVGRHFYPSFQQIRGAGQIVILHHASTIGFNLAPDIYFV
jgi:hypothetical protein